MSFFLLLVYIAFSYIRPGELFPELAPYRVMLVVQVLAMGGTVLAMAFARLRPGHTTQLYLLAAFVLWVMFSRLVQGWVGGAMEALEYLAPATIVCALLLFNVDSLRRLRMVTGLLVVLSIVLVVQGALAFHFGYHEDLFIFDAGVGEEGQLEIAPDLLAEGQERTIKRIRSLGLLNDPNDLAQALMAILPYVFLWGRRGRYLRNAVVVGVPVAVLLYGVYLTRSRGGVLTGLALLALAAQERVGRVLSILLTVACAFVILAVGIGSRSFTMDASAEGRTEAWSLGMEMLRDSPIWGVGFHQFTEYTHLVAHNSFVHCFAELGLVGYVIWLAMLLVPLFQVWSLWRRKPKDPLDVELDRWGRAASLSLVGFMVAGFFLSRTYSPILFLALGLAGALVGIARREGRDVARLPVPLWAAGLGTVAVGSIAGIYVLVRML